MIRAILSELLNSISSIFRRKSLDFNAPKELFSLFYYSSWFLIVFILYIFWYLHIKHLSLLIFILILWIVVIWLILWKINQTLYKRNKMSSLMPYQNISRIVVIIFWFLIYQDTSLITLIIAIITTIIIALFSIDFKNYTVSKDIKIYSVVQIINWIITLTIVYILKDIWNINYFLYMYIIWIIFISSVVWYKWQFKQALKLPKKFYYYRLAASHIWWVSYLLSLLVIENLWATLSILVSYVWLSVTLLFTYLFLWEKISKKDIILSIIVSLLIWIWYIYK